MNHKTDHGPLLFRFPVQLSSLASTRADPAPAPRRRAPGTSDAARNREALLAPRRADRRALGVDAVTMDAVAARAGVGKGTVFRRFESREGLMAAVLNRSETAFQGAILSGPPPLGPGAPPMERLLAFGHARIELNRQSTAP